MVESVVGALQTVWGAITAALVVLSTVVSTALGLRRLRALRVQLSVSVDIGETLISSADPLSRVPPPHHERVRVVVRNSGVATTLEQVAVRGRSGRRSRSPVNVTPRAAPLRLEHGAEWTGFLRQAEAVLHADGAPALQVGVLDSVGRRWTWSDPIRVPN